MLLVILGCSTLFGYILALRATRGGREGAAKRKRQIEEKRQIDYWTRVWERGENVRHADYRAHIEREAAKQEVYDIEATTREAIAFVKETVRAEATARARMLKEVL